MEGGILDSAPDAISASALRAFGSDHARGTRSANPQHQTQERPPVAITARTQATSSGRAAGGGGLGVWPESGLVPCCESVAAATAYQSAHRPSNGSADGQDHPRTAQ